MEKYTFTEEELDHRITDEEYSKLLAEHEEIRMTGRKGNLFRIVDDIILRIESEREQKGREIGPDYLGECQRKFKRLGYFTSEEHMKQFRKTISRYLKGRMEYWKRQEGAGRVVHEIKTLHEALCGEVGDE